MNPDPGASEGETSRRSFSDKKTERRVNQMRGLDSRPHTALSVVSLSIDWIWENPNRGFGVRLVSPEIPRIVADSTSRRVLLHVASAGIV